MFNHNIFEHFITDEELKKKYTFNSWTIAISILSIIFSSYFIFLANKKKNIFLFILLIILAITVLYLTIIEKDNMTKNWFNNNSDIANGLLLGLSILCLVLSFLLFMFT